MQLSAPNSLSALSATLNGTQVFRLSDFAAGATSADRVATLAASNTLAVQVAGATGTTITVSVFTLVMPKPVSLAPAPGCHALLRFLRAVASGRSASISRHAISIEVRTGVTSPTYAVSASSARLRTAAEASRRFRARS